MTALGLLLTTKDEALKSLLELCRKFKMKIGSSFKRIRIDHGGELKMNHFRSFMMRMG